MKNVYKNEAMEKGIDREVVSNYESTINYNNADEAYEEFLKDYEDEATEADLIYASAKLSDYYSEHGYKNRFVFEEDKGGDVFREIISAQSRDEAVLKAIAIYSGMTPYDRRHSKCTCLLGKFDDRGNVYREKGTYAEDVEDVLWNSETEGA